MSRVHRLVPGLNLRLEVPQRIFLLFQGHLVAPVKAECLEENLAPVMRSKVSKEHAMMMLVLMVWLPVGCHCSSCVSWLVHLLLEFHRRHPQAQVEVKVVFPGSMAKGSSSKAAANFTSQLHKLTSQVNCTSSLHKSTAQDYFTSQLHKVTSQAKFKRNSQAPFTSSCHQPIA